jgi:NADH dehydrogenase
MVPTSHGEANAPLNVVTGAFGFTGKHIAARLLSAGERVRTLTGHSGKNVTWRDQVERVPLTFENFGELVRSMKGATTLFNTYWVRFARNGLTHAEAVANIGVLVRAAVEAGIGRIVHISVTNPSLDSPLTYFRGKAEVEAIIEASGLRYAILRPAVVFGEEDILINNIAWLLRRFPLFAIPGDGQYRVQPIFVEDLAALAVECAKNPDNLVMDAVGPETYSYDELVALIRATVGSEARIVHVGLSTMGLMARLVGHLVNDVVLTKEEIEGLMADLLVSHQVPTAATRLSSWVAEHAQSIGQSYASELARHYERQRCA